MKSFITESLVRVKRFQWELVDKSIYFLQKYILNSNIFFVSQNIIYIFMPNNFVFKISNEILKYKKQK